MPSRQGGAGGRQYGAHGQCKGKKGDNTRCTYNAKDSSGYCDVHKGQNRNRAPPSGSSSGASTSRASASKHPSISAATAHGQCKAIKASDNERCTAKAKEDGYCGNHKGQASSASAPAAAGAGQASSSTAPLQQSSVTASEDHGQCQAKTAKGAQCTKPAQANGYCGIPAHQAKANTSSGSAPSPGAAKASSSTSSSQNQPRLATQQADILPKLWKNMGRTSLFDRIKTVEAYNTILSVFGRGPTHANEGPGHTYIYHEADRRGRRLNSKLHKFGTTDNTDVPQKRIAAQIIKCGKNYVVDEVFQTKMHRFTEDLVSAELKGRGMWAGNTPCQCGVTHREWYKGSFEDIKTVVVFWTKWANAHATELGY